MARTSKPSSDRLVIVETKVDLLEQSLDKLVESVNKIKDNHLHDITISLTNLQTSVDTIKSCREELLMIEKRLDIQEIKSESFNQLKKLIIALGVILAPASLGMILTTLKNFLHF